MKYAKGIMWLNDCRIPFVDEGENSLRNTTRSGLFNTIDIHKRTNGNTQGRFTPNLLVCDDMLNDGSVSKTGDINPYLSKDDGIWGIMKGKTHTNSFKGDKGTNSRYYDLDKWFDNILEKL